MLQSNIHKHTNANSKAYFQCTFLTLDLMSRLTVDVCGEDDDVFSRAASCRLRRLCVHSSPPRIMARVQKYVEKHNFLQHIFAVYR